MEKISKISTENIARGIKKYQRIMDQLHKVDVSVSREFQRDFNGFYRIRQRNETFYQCYYAYMEDQKNNGKLTFQEVLTYLYQQTGRMEASFSSKLLATIRPEMPIWDAMVLRNLGLKAPPTNAPHRLEKIISIYDAICKWYETDGARGYAQMLDQLFPETGLTTTKKADFILWQMRED